MESTVAPASRDREFHLVKAEYADRSIRRAVEEKRLIPDDADLMHEFLTEVEASQGICESRKNKIVCLLLNWRRFLPPFRDCTIGQVFSGISAIKTVTNQRGRPRDVYDIGQLAGCLNHDAVTGILNWKHESAKGLSPMLPYLQGNANGFWCHGTCRSGIR